MGTQRPAKERVLSARVRLLTQIAPFYGTILMRLKFSEDASQPTACTDGITLKYNPAFIDSIPDYVIVCLMAHEAGHVALNHPYRMNPQRYDHKRANVAMDHAINLTLKNYTDKAGRKPFTIPSTWLCDPQYTGMNWEQIYALLPADPQGNQGKNGQPDPNGTGNGQQQPGQPDPNPGPGEVRPYPAADAAALKEAEARQIQATMQAADACAKFGTIPGDIARMCAELKKPVVNWPEVLRQFFTRTTSENTWKTPRRRALAAGMYLPAKTGTKCPPLVVVRDTSGSTTAFAPQFTAEIAAIHADMKPDRLVILDVDSRVAHVHDFESFDTVPGNLKMYGGGGTRFAPAFAWVEANMEEQPAALVYLTDLDGPDPVDVPPYPVLWVSTDKRQRSFAFGERIDMNP